MNFCYYPKLIPKKRAMSSLIPVGTLARSRFYFSYTLTDVGFGCMLRSAQMMAANCLRVLTFMSDGRDESDWISLFLGDDAVFEKLRHDINYKTVLSSFNHDSGCLGILALLGEKGRSYFGPRTSSLLLAKSINGDNSDYPHVRVHVALDRMVFRDQVLSDEAEEGATILIVTCRLGCDSISSPLASSISRWMQDSTCSGMLCGKEGRGMYAFNCDGLHLHCLDPHALRCFDGQMGGEDFLLSDENLRQIHTKNHHVELAIHDMDPEVAISFVFPDREALGKWLGTQVVDTPSDDEMFSVLETAPHYGSIGSNEDTAGDADGWSVL